MPRDRLAFAIRIGREDQTVRAFDGFGDVRHALRRLGVDVPQHGEIGLRVDRTVLRRQVANVAIRGINLEILPQIFIDRLGLRRRLDDDNIHPERSLFMRRIGPILDRSASRR
jgi:hypothetical protein